MADDKKIIFSMVGVNKIFPPQKQVLKNIYQRQVLFLWGEDRNHRIEWFR